MPEMSSSENSIQPEKEFPGKLVVISGPSGVGKSTVVRQVIDRCGGRVRLSVSATTREPRPGEQNGVDYHFLSPLEFSQKLAANEFLECAEVFGRGYWYGTLWSEVRPSLEAGEWVILEIDVEGAQDVIRRFPAAITIFIRTKSPDELERRLRARATEPEEVIQRRLSVARHELERIDQYEYQVVNDSVVEAVDEICRILKTRGLND